MIYLPKKAKFFLCASLISLLGIATTYAAEVCPCPTSEEVRALFQPENIWEDQSDSLQFMLKSPYIGYFSPTPVRWTAYKRDDLESYRNVNLTSRYEEPRGIFHCRYSFKGAKLELRNELVGCR